MLAHMCARARSRDTHEYYARDPDRVRLCVCEFTCVCVHLNIQPYTIFRVTAAPADDDDDAAEEHAENVR